MAKAQTKSVVINGVRYVVDGKTKATKTKENTGIKGFNEKLKEMKTFINRKRNTEKIESIVPNGKIQKTTYTTKNGVTKTYEFKGATIVYKSGKTENKYYLDTPFYLKGMFGTPLN